MSTLVPYSPTTLTAVAPVAANDAQAGVLKDVA